MAERVKADIAAKEKELRQSLARVINEQISNPQTGKETAKMLFDALYGKKPFPENNSFGFQVTVEYAKKVSISTIENAFSAALTDALKQKSFEGRIKVNCKYEDYVDDKGVEQRSFSVIGIEPVFKNSITLSNIQASLEGSSSPYTVSMNMPAEKKLMESIERLAVEAMRQKGMNLGVEHSVRREGGDVYVDFVFTKIAQRSQEGENMADQVKLVKKKEAPQFIFLEAPNVKTSDELAKLRIKQTETLIGQLNSDLLMSATDQINVSNASEKNKTKALEAITFANENFAKAQKSEVAKYKVIFAFMSALRFMDDDPKLSESGNELLNKAKTLDKPIYSEWFERREEFNSLMNKFNERALKTTRLVKREPSDVPQIPTGTKQSELTGGLQTGTTPYIDASNKMADLPQRASEATSKKELQAILDEQRRVNQSLLEAIKEDDKGTIMAIQGKLLFLQTRVSKMTMDELKAEVVTLTKDNKDLVNENSKRFDTMALASILSVDYFGQVIPTGRYTKSDGTESSYVTQEDVYVAFAAKHNDLFKLGTKQTSISIDDMAKKIGMSTVTTDSILRFYASKKGVDYAKLSGKTDARGNPIPVSAMVIDDEAPKARAKASEGKKAESRKEPQAKATFTKTDFDGYFAKANTKGDYTHTLITAEAAQAAYDFVTKNYSVREKEGKLLIKGSSVRTEYDVNFEVSIESGFIKIKKVR